MAKNKKNWTRPERIAADWFDAQGIKYEYNKKIDRYYPDFHIVGTMTIIEIDGQYWHDKDKDAIRDLRLTELGYVVYRIDTKLDIPTELLTIFTNNSV